SPATMSWRSIAMAGVGCRRGAGSSISRIDGAANFNPLRRSGGSRDAFAGKTRLVGAASAARFYREAGVAFVEATEVAMAFAVKRRDFRRPRRESPRLPGEARG